MCGRSILLVDPPELAGHPVRNFREGDAGRVLRLMLGNRDGIEFERGFDEETLDRLFRVPEER